MKMAKSHQIVPEMGKQARKHWDAPRLQRLAAGSAEIGANPDNPEGEFAEGS